MQVLGVKLVQPVLQESLQPLEIKPLQKVFTYVGYPLQLVAMNLLGPLPENSSKNSYVLVVSDYFTKYTEAYTYTAKPGSHKSS